MALATDDKTKPACIFACKLRSGGNRAWGERRHDSWNKVERYTAFLAQSHLLTNTSLSVRKQLHASEITNCALHATNFSSDDEGRGQISPKSNYFSGSPERLRSVFTTRRYTNPRLPLRFTVIPSSFSVFARIDTVGHRHAHTDRRR